MLSFISDTDHYASVLDLVTKARETLWIGTADIKDLYVVQGKKIVDAAIEEFDKVWRGSECKKCRRRELCPDPIA